MTLAPKSSLLTEELSLLVKHFGVRRVETALAKVRRSIGDEHENIAARNGGSRGKEPARTNGVQALESIRELDPEKHRLLSDFLFRIKDRRILPASQDIRYFAQIVGLKEISGKSREDLIPKLMRFLVEQPTDKLHTDLERANSISEQQRKMGFSVLTDKLVGRADGPSQAQDRPR